MARLWGMFLFFGVNILHGIPLQYAHYSITCIHEQSCVKFYYKINNIVAARGKHIYQKLNDERDAICFHN